MTDPAAQAISDYVTRLSADPDFAKEVGRVAGNLVKGDSTVADLHVAMGVDAQTLQAIMPEDAAEQDMMPSTSVTTVTTATLTSPTTVTTTTSTTIM